MKEKIEAPKLVKELVPLIDFHSEVHEESYLQGYSICDLLIEEEELPYLRLDSILKTACLKTVYVKTLIWWISYLKIVKLVTFTS